MTSIGWEFWGLKFSWVLTALVSAGLMLYTWLSSHDAQPRQRLDTMAGDEGEEW